MLWTVRWYNSEPMLRPTQLQICWKSWPMNVHIQTTFGPRSEMENPEIYAALAEPPWENIYSLSPSHIDHQLGPKLSSGTYFGVQPDVVALTDGWLEFNIASDKQTASESPLINRVLWNLNRKVDTLWGITRTPVDSWTFSYAGIHIDQTWKPVECQYWDVAASQACGGA